MVYISKVYLMETVSQNTVKKTAVDALSEMSLFQAIKARRSIRFYEDKPVPREMLEQLIELATYAPSNCNIQGWRFIIIDDQEIKKQLTDMGASVLINKAPQGILVLYDHRSTNSEYQDWLQSGAAATQNLILASHALGLGTCWVCHLPPRRQLRGLLDIPAFFSPVAYILIGYKKKMPLEVPRKYRSREMIGYNIFPAGTPVEKVNPIFLNLKRLLIWIYYRIPRSFKKRFLNDYIDQKFVKKFEN